MRRPEWVQIVGTLAIIFASIAVFLGIYRSVVEPALGYGLGSQKLPAEWLVISGVIELLVAVFYMVGAIYLLQMRKYAPKVFGSALVVSIVFYIVRRIYELGVFRLEEAAIPVWIAGWIAVDVIFLIVLLTANKKPFYEPQPPVAKPVILPPQQMEGPQQPQAPQNPQEPQQNQ